MRGRVPDLWRRRPAGRPILNNLNVSNSIIAGSSGSDCAFEDVLVLNIDYGYNLDSDSTCFYPFTGSLPGVNPMLGALASNGGTTQTRALAPLSPAVDAIPTCPSVPVDQRGTVRPQGSACDIGAYELKAPWIAEVTVDSGVSGSPASVSGTITCNQGAPFTVSVTLTQGKKKALGTSSAGTCNGSTPVPWTASVSPGTFAPGAAKVSYTATDGTSKKGSASTTLT